MKEFKEYIEENGNSPGDVFLPELPPCNEIDKRKRDPIKSLGVVIGISLLMLLVAYFICGYFVKNTETGEDISIKADVVEEERAEWVGAFLSREISKECLDVSVRIRLGAAGEYGARGASGVIVDENGWVATSNFFLDGGQKGRIYVLLSDGREYPVEKIVREGELAFLKIEADRLNAVEFDRDVNVCLGLSVFALSSGGSPEHKAVLSSGIVSEIDEHVIRTDITLSSSGAGSPIFDEQGRLLGLWLEEDESILGVEKLQEKMRMIKGK